MRNIQQHGNVMSHTVSGQRTALNGGLGKHRLARGHVILREDPVPPTSIIDMSYSHLNDVQLKAVLGPISVGPSEVLARFTLWWG